MGSIIYNFFSESILSHNGSIDNNFKNETIGRLEKELEDYRQFCIRNFSSIIQEIINFPSVLKTFTSIDFVPKKFLTQTALYLDQCVLPDPLFKLTEKKGGQSFSEYLGFQKSELNKKDIAKACKYLKDILPMIVGDFVKIFPISYYFERPIVPMYGPDHYFNNDLPPDVLAFFQSNAIVRPLSKLSSGGWAITDNELKPCRAISVEMEGDDWNRGMIYFLVESEAITFDKKESTVIYRHILPDTIPAKAEFDRWVDQSTRSLAKNYFDAIYFENLIASDINATYLTNNDFTGKLIDTVLRPKESVQTFTANQILNIDLPFLEKIDVEKLMQVRTNDADVFTSFRLELEKSFRELRTTHDDKQLRIKAESIFHELNEVQGLRIKRKMDHLVKQVSINSVLAIGGLAAIFSTSGASLFATLFALIKGYKDYEDYKEKVIENPAYFLWKVKK